MLQQVQQKAKWTAVEGDQNASVSTQLVKQKAKWAAIIDGDHNASITTHIEKKTESNAGTIKQQRVRTSKFQSEFMFLALFLFELLKMSKLTRGPLVLSHYLSTEAGEKMKLKMWKKKKKKTIKKNII